MIFWWMGYAAGIGVLLAGGAWAGERLCENMGWPRRFPWVAALTLAVVIPLSARAAAPVLEVSAGAPSPITSVVQAADPAVPAISGTGWERAAIFAWGAASLATLLVFGAILAVMTRSRRRWPRRSVDGEDVYVSEGFGPALIGVTRPSVVIPDWLFCEGDRAGRVAILHEREHARARDHLTLLYGAVVAALFPWSPAVWWMVRNLRGAVEIDCDRRVIASGIPADDYGELLLAIGVGQQRRWVLTPALLESRHSLERRLKIMAARKMKWSPMRAVTLAGVTVAALVVACDTNAPTALDDALLDVLTDPEAAVNAEGTDNPGALQIRGALADDAPLIFVDGVRLDEGSAALSSLNPDDIDRIEVIKGQAAVGLYGERGERGVIQIHTKVPQPSEPGEPPPDDTPPPPNGSELGLAVASDNFELVIPGHAGDRALELREFRDRLEETDGTLAPLLPTDIGTADRSVDPASATVDLRASFADGPRPLIFIDDLEVPSSAGSPLQSLNPDDIDRIEVVKGGAATALFGERAAEGIIYIYLKDSSQIR